MFKRVLFLLLLSMIFGLSLYAQTPKPIVQELYDFGGYYPDNVIYPEEGTIEFKVWIVTRPEYVIPGPDARYGSLAYIHEESGRFILIFDVGNFKAVGAPVDFQPGEIVRVEATQTTTGRIATGEFAIESGSAGQFLYNEKAIVLKNPATVLFDSRPDIYDEISTSANMVAGYPTEGTYRADGWSTNKYWEISLSTKGFASDLHLTSNLRREYDDDDEVYGPRRFATSYSIDGGDTWIQYPDGNHFLPSQGDDWERIAFDLPEAVYNHENVRIRWTLNSMAGVTGGWGEIKDVVVTGYPAYTLTIACDGEGNTEPEPGAYSFDEGQSVRVEALAEVEGWIFDKWVVDGEEIEEAELTIFMDKDKVATAYFIEWPNPNPTVAIEPQPQDGATRVPTDTELGWTYRHNEDYKNPLGYRLIIGKSSTLEDATELYVAGGPGEYLVYPPIDLEQSTEYFWQVVPTTNGGGIIRANILDNDDATRGDAEECPIWSFKTSFEVIDRVTWAEDFTDREFPPEGWGSLQVAGEGLFERSIYGDDPETGPYSSPGMAAFLSHEYAAGTTAALVTPKIALEEGEYRFSFWMYRDHALHDKADRVVLYKNNQPNLTGATEIQTYHRTTALEPTEEEEGWHYYSRIVQISGTEPEYIIIKAIGEGGNNMYLDYVSLEYAPANPTLDVTPIAHNFGRQKIHTESEPMTFTLKNIGSGVITLDPDKIILEGDDQDSFTLTNIEEQIELRAEESTTIQVTFAPESVGEKRVDLIIDDNIQPPSLLINQLRKGNGVDTEQTRSNHIVNISGVGYETILYLPLVESFDASEKPEDWKAVPGGTSNWVISETAEAGGESFELKCEKIGDTGYTRFSTPAIHTDGMTLLLLSFKHKLNVTGDNVEVTIEASHDEEYWQEQLWQLKAEDVNDDAEEVVTYIVHPIFEKTYISWVVQGDDEDFDSWYIDDIKVEMSDLRRISGIVTSPFDRAELQGALVEIIDTDLSALTNMYGIYHIIGTPMGIFDIKASYEGHTTHTYENYELGEDKVTYIDFELHEKTSLNITGRVVGSDDPANGLADAQLILALDDYSESIITDETGYFAFEWMPQYNTYELRIIHPKYETIIREIVAEFDDIELGDLYMKELTSPPINVVAEVQNNDELLLSWEKALTPATGEWLETFAEGVLPQGWDITGVNTDASGEYPGYWTIIQDASIDDNYGAMVFWSFEHQDEWLITNDFTCPVGDLSYWTFGYQGSQEGDNYYVKVSTDGGETWEVLQNLSAYEEEGWNEYAFPYEISLADYYGEKIRLAWHAEDPDTNDGLWNLWAVDYISVGNLRFRGADLVRQSNGVKSEFTAARINSSVSRSDLNIAKRLRSNSSSDVHNTRDASRAHEGYFVYRLTEETKEDEAEWSQLIEITSIDELSFLDRAWGSLEEGDYLYAVKGLYTNGLVSEPAFSNKVTKVFGAEVVVNVTSNSGDSVTDALVELTSDDEVPVVYSENVAADGKAIFPLLPFGTYKISVTLKGFDEYMEEGIEITTTSFEYDVELIESLLPVQELEYEYDNDTVYLRWVEPGVEKVEFRYDDGVQYSQIGVTGSSFNSVMGSAFKRTAEVREISWYLTDEGGSHSYVTVYVFGLNEEGVPDSDLLLYKQSYVDSKNLVWNIYKLEEPVYAPNGFIVGLGYGGFLGLGTDDGVGEPYEFKDGTTFGTFNYRTLPWDDLGKRENPIRQNFMIRAYGYDFGPVDHVSSFASNKSKNTYSSGLEYTLIHNGGDENYSIFPAAPNYYGNYSSEYFTEARALQGYRVVRNGEVIADNITETEYTDTGLTNGTYIYSVYALYSTGESEPVMTEEITVVSAEEVVEIPVATELVGNYPNPFNPDTKISFNMRESGNVSIEIYNIKGQKVKTLLNDEVEAGKHIVVWDGRNDNNQTVGSGMFFYRMTTATYTSTKKMIMLK